MNEQIRKLVALYCTEQDDHDFPKDKCQKCSEMTEAFSVLFAALASTAEQVREQAFQEAAKHWPIGELGELPDFKCSCGVLLPGRTTRERLDSWQGHIRALAQECPICGFPMSDGNGCHMAQAKETK